MRRGLVVLALTGCRQLLGIEDGVTTAIDSAADQAVDQPVDTPLDQAPDTMACSVAFTFSFNNHVYFKSPNSNETWPTAKTSCEVMGGHLAVPDDLAEVTFWSDVIGDIRWIGVRKVTGQWETVLGDPFSETSPLWAPNQPAVANDIAKVIDSSVSLGTDNSANDFDAGYICECP